MVKKRPSRREQPGGPREGGVSGAGGRAPSPHLRLRCRLKLSPSPARMEADLGAGRCARRMRNVRQTTPDLQVKGQGARPPRSQAPNCLWNPGPARLQHPLPTSHLGRCDPLMLSFNNNLSEVRFLMIILLPEKC